MKGTRAGEQNDRSRSKGAIVIAACLSLLSASILLNVYLLSVLYSHPDQSDPLAKAGTSFVSGLRITGPHGTRKTLKFAGDRTTVLYVFSPECRYCAQNEPAIQALSHRLTGNVNVVLASLTDVGLDDYLNRHHITQSAVVVDSSDARLHSLIGTPQTIVVGQNGIAQRVWAGAFTSPIRDEIQSFFGVSIPALDSSKSK